MSPGPLSVVVPTRDRPEHLAACLRALRAALRDGDELIVADSASRDPSVRAVAEAAGARVVRCEEPGASRARNAGAAAAAHDLLAFVDDDVEVTPGWAAAMATALETSGAAFVCGRVTAPPDQGDAPRPVAVTPGDTERRIDRTCVRDLGNSANLGVRRDRLDAVAGFDERLGGGARFHAAEDLDLFDRLLLAGDDGWYAPEALGWHDQWRSRRDLVTLDWRYGFGSGARLAKLARTDRRRARLVVREVLWETDLRAFFRVVRDRHEFAALTIGLRLVGTVAGLLVAATWKVDAGHYRPRRDHL